MAEDALNTLLLKTLKEHHPIRVENSVYAGTPDINYTGGWIECKHLPRWPKMGSVVKVNHFTPQQRVFHTLRCLRGGVSYVMLQVERDYVLLRGDVAAQELGKVTEDELCEVALGVWRGRLNKRELIDILVLE